MNRPGTTCSQDDRHRQVLVFERVEKEQRASLLSLAGGSFHGEQILQSLPEPPQVNALDKYFTADLTPRLLSFLARQLLACPILRLKLILSRN